MTPTFAPVLEKFHSIQLQRAIKVNEENPNPAAAHHTITTARRPDNARSSARVPRRSRSTQFMPRQSSGH